MQRPSGIYSLRLDVPQRLRSLLGKRKFVISLETRDLTTALIRFKPVLARVLALIHAGDAALLESPPRLTPVQIEATEREIATRLADQYQAPPVVVPGVPGLPDDHPLASLSLRADPSDSYRQQAVLVERDFRAAVAAGPDAASRWRQAQVEAAQLLVGRVWHPDDQWAVALAYGSAQVRALQIASGRHQDWAEYRAASARLEQLPDPAVVLPSPTGGPGPGGLAVLDLAERWIEARRPAPKTAVAARFATSRFVAITGTADAAAVTATEARQFRDARMDEVSGTTVRKDLAVLAAIWRWAVSDGLLPADPWAGIRVSRADGAAGERLPFNTEQITLLLERSAELSDPAERWAWPLGLLLGLRIEEIACLRREDLLLIEGIQCLQIRHEAQLRGQTKTAAGERLIPLPAALLALGFWDWASAQGGGYLFVVGGIPASDPRRSHGLSIRCGNALRRWGIHEKRWVFHSTRHTFCRRAVEAGMPDRLLQQLMGHSSAKSMTTRYGGSFPVSRLKAEIDSIVWPVPTTQKQQSPAS